MLGVSIMKQDVCGTTGKEWMNSEYKNDARMLIEDLQPGAADALRPIAAGLSLKQVLKTLKKGVRSCAAAGGLRLLASTRHFSDENHDHGLIDGALPQPRDRTP